MTDLLCYIVGLASGVGVTLLGLWIGFKLSYDIRRLQIDEEIEVNPLRKPKETEEFKLMENNDVA